MEAAGDAAGLKDAGVHQKFHRLALRRLRLLDRIEGTVGLAAGILPN
jgi:hypothetical protein